MDMFKSLGNGLLIQYGPDVAKQSVENWIKIASTMVYSIGKRMVEFKFRQNSYLLDIKYSLITLKSHHLSFI